MVFRTLVFLLPVFGFCQSQYRFDHFSIKNGLSQNTVNCILRDSEGYYWLGTQDGLNRYDGYGVKIFQHNRDDSTTLSDNFILTLFEDNRGNLWIGTRNGLNHFDKRSGVFTRIHASEKEKVFFHNSIYNVIQDGAGNIFFSNYFREVVKITAEDIKAPPFHCLISDKNKLIYNSSEHSYCVNDSSVRHLILYNKKDHRERSRMENFYPQSHIAILETKSGQLLITGEKGLLTGNEKRDTLLRGKYVTKFLQDRFQNIWVGTSTGLYIFEKGDLDKAPVQLLHSPDDPHTPGSNSVQGLYEDPQGLVWVGTSEGGVSIYDPHRSVFRIFNQHSAVPLPANSVWGVYQDGNELWTGTNAGLCLFRMENASVTGVYNGANKVVNREVFTRTTAFPNSICSNFITAITKDKQGDLWFGSHDNGISVYATSTKKWRHINTKNSALRSDAIFHLHCASDGTVWASTMSGLYGIDPVSGKILPVIAESLGGILPIGYIISSYEDTDGTLWAASTIGICHLKHTGEKIATYFSSPQDPKSMSYNMATCALRSKKGALWIGTLGGGLNLFDDKTGSFRSFRKKDGLANDVIYSLLEDKTGRIWMSTNAGLSCFDPEKELFMNYTEKDGLPAHEFTQNSGCGNTAGEFLFGTPNGLVAFDPSKIKTEKRTVPVVYSALKINYDAVNYFSGDPVELHYGDQTVTFEFTAPDIREQEKIRYAFRLEGFDEQWHEVPASGRTASFTNLPFGSYLFKVRIKNGSADWQEAQIGVPLHVIPPFWLRAWFILLEILAGIGIIIFIVRYYSQRKLRQQLREAEVQKKIHEEKERISRDLHDNVGSHLTYIITSLDNMSYKMEKGDKNVALEKISSLSDFSRSTMQQLRETIWAIHKQNITLAELRDKISEYAGRMAAANNMHFNIDLFNEKNDPIKPSHAINIYRVVQEAINNSVKHSQAKALSVKISKNGGDHLSIDVKDNGKGMSTSSNNNGYGLKNMQDRVKDLGGEISIDSNKKGTKVSFTIPI